MSAKSVNMPITKDFIRTLIKEGQEVNDTIWTLKGVVMRFSFRTHGVY